MAQEPVSTERRVPWTVRDMVVASLAALALFAIGIGLLVVAQLIWTASGREAPGQGVQALAIFTLEAILILPAWWWGPRKYGGGWWALGLRRSPSWRMVSAVGLGLIATLAINAGWEQVRQRLGWVGQPDVLPLFGEGIQGLLLALVLGGIVAPVAEEIFFRGYLYPGLRDRLGLGWGLVLSSAVFSIVHVFPGVLLPIFLMGLIFAWLYERYDSLWPCILLHGAINTLAFLAAYAVERFPQAMGG
jgi:uncharacterized protein